VGPASAEASHRCGHGAHLRPDALFWIMLCFRAGVLAGKAFLLCAFRSGPDPISSTHPVRASLQGGHRPGFDVLSATVHRTLPWGL